MKGGVGKSTLAFNLAWYAAWQRNLRVLAIDLDPQANLSQYFLGAQGYLEYLDDSDNGSIVEVFEQLSLASRTSSSPTPFDHRKVIHKVHSWHDGSSIHLVPSRLELAWTLKNPTEKAHLLPRFVSQVVDDYDLIILDCAPTESILTTAAYLTSRYVLVPVKPEFLATVGLPLLARSLQEFRASRDDAAVEIIGIVFSDGDPTHTRPEHKRAREGVRQVAQKHGWPVFENEARHSDSYATGSRTGTPIFLTDYARSWVKGEFSKLGAEFLKRVGL